MKRSHFGGPGAIAVRHEEDQMTTYEDGVTL